MELSRASTVAAPQDRAVASPLGFTLLEIMLVVGIMGIVLAMGLPSIVRTLQRDPLQQAVNDVVEALSHARAHAILRGWPAEVVLDGEGRVVVQLRPRRRADPDGGGGEADREDGPEGGAGIFRAQLGEDIMITFLGVNLVNLVDLSEATEARVRFHPNGTSDDFTLVMEDGSGARRIDLDPITGFTEVTLIR